jgi:hypothetical protein
MLTEYSPSYESGSEPVNLIDLKYVLLSNGYYIIIIRKYMCMTFSIIPCIFKYIFVSEVVNRKKGIVEVKL